VYAYGSYVDEVLCYTTGQGAQQQRYYPHYNHLYSVAALTGDKLPNGNVPVVERYTYNAYGKQTITSPSGIVRAKSAVGFDRAFTGYVADNETGLLHARARQYSPTLGRFIERDPMKYVDGMGLYGSYFVLVTVDPDGMSIPWTGGGSQEGDTKTNTWTGYSARTCSAKCGEGPVTVNITASITVSSGVAGGVPGFEVSVGASWTGGDEASVTCDLSGTPYGDGKIKKRLKIVMTRIDTYTCRTRIFIFPFPHFRNVCRWEPGNSTTDYSEDRVEDTSSQCKCKKEETGAGGSGGGSSSGGNP